MNPASGGNAASGTAISGGKYVAEGVYVGATQGLTPQSNKVIVEIEVRRASPCRAISARVAAAVSA